MQTPNPHESAAAAMVRLMRTTGRPSPELADLARAVFAAASAGRAQRNAGESAAADDGAAGPALLEPPTPTSITDIGPRHLLSSSVVDGENFSLGVLIGRLENNDLTLSFCGRPLFGADLGALLAMVADQLGTARRVKPIERVNLVCDFGDDDDDGGEWPDDESGAEE